MDIDVHISASSIDTLIAVVTLLFSIYVYYKQKQ